MTSTSSAAQLVFYACVFGGFLINVVTFVKAKDINMYLYNICKLSYALCPHVPVGSKLAKWHMRFHVLGLLIFLTFMSFYFFYQEWKKLSEAVTLPFMFLNSFRDESISIIFSCIILSFVFSANISGTMLMLCGNTYASLGNIIKAYRKRLQNKFRSGNYMKEPLTVDIKILNMITKQVELADGALNTCTVLLYGMFICMFYITISIGLSEDESFKTKVVIWYIVWNFIIAIYLFSRLTLSGYRVQKENKKLQDTGIECSRIIVTSPADEYTLLTFSLLLASIKDSNLTVTVGGMFVIEKGLFLTVAGTIVTYGVILFQMNK
ncbi:hypothetical protein AVEN_34842-1 [Araneus ventricosus]|uniref:Gustatory receptor n=1 Tax=Araneus ventricosus TaxID=182803 RepID=A0A4Y2MDB3_ARAVE|nr:hypothetical protein AVEN_34842-1 [Araneus ventricosus]